MVGVTEWCMIDVWKSQMLRGGTETNRFEVILLYIIIFSSVANWGRLR